MHRSRFFLQGERGGGVLPPPKYLQFFLNLANNKNKQWKMIHFASIKTGASEYIAYLITVISNHSFNGFHNQTWSWKMEKKIWFLLILSLSKFFTSQVHGISIVVISLKMSILHTKFMYGNKILKMLTNRQTDNTIPIGFLPFQAGP